MREGGREGISERGREGGREEGSNGGGREGGDSLIQQVVDHVTLVVLGGKVERRLLVHVSAVHNLLLGIQQHLHHLHKPVPRGYVQWHPLLLLHGLNVGSIQEKNSYDLLIPALAGKMEGSVVLVVLSMDQLSLLVETVSKDEVDDVRDALLAGKVKRRLLLVIQCEQIQAFLLHPLKQGLHYCVIA